MESNMKLKIKQDFPYWHRGTQRVDYVAGVEVNVDDAEMAHVAVTEGWADAAEAEQADDQGNAGDKSHAGAPENKDAAKQRKTKG
jgi:hypothetical protein